MATNDYQPQTWVDGPQGDTPIDAQALEHIESGIANHAHTQAALLAALAGALDTSGAAVAAQTAAIQTASARAFAYAIIIP